MARLIQCEAGGEGDDGMRAVATVVMNRVQTPYGEYGRYNTVREVILAPTQFSCVTNPVQNIYAMSPSDVQYNISSWAINGGRLGAVADSLWFFNPYALACPGTFPNQSGSYFIRVGQHCFYRPTAVYYST